MTRAYGEVLAPLDLTYLQYVVLLVLWEEDGVTVKALGERLTLDSGTLTPLLKRLEQRGVVSRTRDPDDERALRIRLTAEGKALRAKARRVPERIARLAGYEPGDPRSLAKLERLRDELQELAVALHPLAR